MDGTAFLRPNDVLDLAVLGVTNERARPAPEIVAVVKRVGGPRFQPTGEVIADRLAALAEAGLVVPRPGRANGEPVWQPSAAGRAHIHRLLVMRGGSPTETLAAVCGCLKICFLEMLEPAARAAVLEDLLTAHRRVLDEARAALGRCPCRCSLVQRCLARDVERWQAEIAWLEALRFEVEVRARPAVPA
jgi:hypothetical protein